jgi:hypothetical protein
MVQRKDSTHPVPAINLKQVPEGKVLLLRNVRAGGAISIRSGQRGLEADPDITLERRHEIVVPATWATSSSDLKKFLSKDWLEVQWVDEDYQIRTIPIPDEAPAEILANLNKNARQFAFDNIAMQGDLDLALSAVNTQVNQPEPRDRMVDARYMRETFFYVLELADWLEERIDNRPKIHSAIKAAKTKIRDM